MPTVPLLDPVRLDHSHTLNRHVPFSFLIAHHQLPEDARGDLERDFPEHARAGFFPYEPRECGTSVNALVEALTTPEFMHAIGERLGIDELSTLPTMVTLCGYVDRRHGTIHTGSRSKVATALLHLNSLWSDPSDGCLRFLSRDDDIDAIVAPEVTPLYGVFAAFRRADNSFHGYLPYEGERRIIQIAWLNNEQARQRKMRRGPATRLFKRLAARLDCRDRHAARLNGAIKRTSMKPEFPVWGR